MRIALFHNLPSGGAKRAVYEWTRRLAARHRIEVHTLTTADHAFCDIGPFATACREYEFRESPLFRSPLGRLNQLQRRRDVVRLEQLGRKIAASIDESGCDVVFANTCQFTFAPAFLGFTRSPAVYFLHEPIGRALAVVGRAGEGPLARLRSGLDRFDPAITHYRRRLDEVQRRSLEGATRVLANSAFTAGRMHEAYGIVTPVCRYGVDVDTFRPLATAGKGGHVLSVGELSPRKGFDFVVASLALIPPAERPILRIACNEVRAEERIYVERLAARVGVQLEIRSGLGTQALVQEYNETPLCVYAPVQEPFGLVPLEAMACGTPVAAVREGGVPESVVHGKTGVLVARDTAEFALAVKDLLGDRATLERLGWNAREHVVGNWTWDRSVGELEGHLAGVARMSGRPAPALRDVGLA
jgi:glycosyltransferase involved in cell wall biosynthesis